MPPAALLWSGELSLLAEYNIATGSNRMLKNPTGCGTHVHRWIVSYNQPAYTWIQIQLVPAELAEFQPTYGPLKPQLNAKAEFKAKSQKHRLIAMFYL